MPDTRPWLRRFGGVFLRPEYMQRPKQLYRRLRRARLVADDAVMLAWGLPISTRPSCFISRDIINVGVFEKKVAEAICRLLDAGELAVDVGANIGQNTSLMAAMSGATGSVHAVEAHPAIHPYLTKNAARWRAPRLAGITVHAVAVGATVGTARIHEPEGFGLNSGTASLCAERGAGISHEVPLTTLETILAGVGPIGVMKLDVEGYELEVLSGARALLDRRAVRDILFEDAEEQQPSAVRRLLIDEGYTIFVLDQRFAGPRLSVPRPTGSALHADYLATRDAGRALARFAPRGWRCLQTTRR